MELEIDGQSIHSIPEKKSTRHKGEAVVEDEPRLGRRESEPHSNVINYVHDVFQTNFPQYGVLWDLHHYFAIQGMKYEIQFDISVFQGFVVSIFLPSYQAAEYANKVPTLTLNGLSKSTYLKDVGLHVDLCKLLQIPFYVIFASHSIESNLYRPPFLRVYFNNNSKQQSYQETREIAYLEGDPFTTIINEKLIDLQPIPPLKLGIFELKKRYFPDFLTYQLLIVDAKTQLPYLTEAQKERMRADQEKTRADQLQKQIDEYRARFGTI